MKAFDIFMWEAPGWQAPHPAVIVSHPLRAANKDYLEVVLCTTQRVNRQPALHEVLLDTADGLDWATFCKCDLVFAVPRGDLKRQKGYVTKERQKHIVRTLIAAHGWPEILTA